MSCTYPTLINQVKIQYRVYTVYNNVVKVIHQQVADEYRLLREINTHLLISPKMISLRYFYIN
jgi:hypothetical protein